MKSRTAFLPVAALAIIVGCGDDPSAPNPRSADPTVPVPQFAPGGPTGSPNVNLDQYANDDLEWQNGNLNGNNSVYGEGRVVPFRETIEGLAPGEHVITINHDFTAGGHKAYDFLASVNATENAALTEAQLKTWLCEIGGGGVSSMCAGGLPDPDKATFPTTPDATVDGKSVAGATTFPVTPPRELRIYGGTIVSLVLGPIEGSTDANSTRSMTVTFHTTGTAVLLAWGGHLARSQYWNDNNPEDGAGQISGAPWHMRTLNLDGGGAANQDRSIQPSALTTDLIPELTIVKESDAATVDAGDQIGFTITLENTGQTNLTNVVLTDDLPPGTGIDWSIQASDPTCSITGSPPTETLNCNFGSLAVGAMVSVHIVSDTEFDSCKEYMNTATADADLIDPVNDAAELDVVCPDLDVEKVPDAATVSAGDDIGFTITITNNGAGTAKNVTLSDPLPAGTGISWVEDPDDQDCSINGSPQTLDCSFGDIAPNTSVTVHIKSGTEFASCAEYPNTATVNANNHPEVTAMGSTEVECPDLEVEKTADAAKVSAGDDIGFTITVTNNGPGTATNVTLNDPLPAGSGVDWSIDPANADCTITGSPGSETLECDFGDLAAGASASVHVKSPTAFASCQEYPNTATADADNHDEVTANATTEVECPDLEIEKTPDMQTVQAGSDITFSIVVTNNGPGAAHDLTLNDPLPTGNGNASWSVSQQPAQGSCSVAAATQILTCDFGDLAALASVTVEVTTATTAADCTLYENTATASASNHDDVEDSGMIDVECPDACTLTIGYWKTHSGFHPPADAVTPLLSTPILLGNVGGAKTVTVSDAATAFAILSFNYSVAGNMTTGPSNGITKLYAQLLGAKLNGRNGADLSSIQATITAADAFLSTKNQSDWNSLTKAKKNQVIAWMSALDAYNNSAHCP